MPFSEITKEFFDGVPGTETFGIRAIDTDVSLMRTEVRGDGRLYFASQEFSPAIHRQEPRAERWRDTQDKQHIAYWWHETVRVSEKHGIEPGDQLVLAYYPNTVSSGPIPSTVDIVPFKNYNKNRKTRGPHALDQPFESEDEFLTWIESTHLDPFQQSKMVVARVARPTPVRLEATQDVEARAPKLVFGLVVKPDTAESLTQKIFEETELHTALNELGREIQQPGEDTIKLAIRIALAGPFRDPSQWYGRPVCDLVIDLVRRLCSHGTTSDEAISMKDVASSPSGKASFSWAQELSIDQLRLELRGEEIALKEMEARREFLELQVRRLTESISAIESLLGSHTNS